MSMTIEEKIAHTDESVKSAHKRLDLHGERITRLEQQTAILESMDYRMGRLEDTMCKVDNKLNERIEEKGKKWDKLIDYLFYFFIAGLLSYITFFNN